MEKALQGKNVIVTGSSMGIGRAVALHFAELGANIVINSSSSSLTTLEKEISGLGVNVISSNGSVAQYEYAKSLIDTCLDQWGAIDCLVNCAGIKESSGNSILTMSPHDWDHVLGVHLTGTFNTCHAAAPHMVKQGFGSIINTGSRAWLGCYGGTAYPAGKGGTISLSWAIANDLKQFGVRCNVICPGAKTRLSSGPDYVALIDDLTKRGLLDESLKEAALNPASPLYVAPLYAYLASDESKEISGQLFSASGGYIGLTEQPDEAMLGYRDHESQDQWSQSDIQQLFLEQKN